MKSYLGRGSMDELVQRAGRKPNKPFADLGGKELEKIVGKSKPE